MSGDPRMPRSTAVMEPWQGQCPLCGFDITNLTAARHLNAHHGTMLCGVSEHGLSRRDVDTIAQFINALKADAGGEG